MALGCCYAMLVRATLPLLALFDMMVVSVIVLNDIYVSLSFAQPVRQLCVRKTVSKDYVIMNARKLVYAIVVVI